MNQQQLTIAATGAVRSATAEFFRTWCPLPLREVSIIATSVGYEIASVIAISGAWSGSIAVHVNRGLAKRITEAILKVTDPPEVDVIDAIGEFSNIVSGNVKNQLVNVDCAIEISCPTVMFGSNVRAMPAKRGFQFGVQFQADKEPFAVMVAAVL